jgi:hypothetical protein
LSEIVILKSTFFITVDSQQVSLIGEWCPELQKLHLKDLGPESGGQDEAGAEVPGPIFALQQNKKLFTNLGKNKHHPFSVCFWTAPGVNPIKNFDVESFFLMILHQF